MDEGEFVSLFSRSPSDTYCSTLRGFFFLPLFLKNGYKGLVAETGKADN